MMRDLSIHPIDDALGVRRLLQVYQHISWEVRMFKPATRACQDRVATTWKLCEDCQILPTSTRPPVGQRLLGARRQKHSKGGHGEQLGPTPC